MLVPLLVMPKHGRSEMAQSEVLADSQSVGITASLTFSANGVLALSGVTDEREVEIPGVANDRHHSALSTAVLP